MFRSKTRKEFDKVDKTRQAPPTIISADMHILGNLVTDGVADIDGQVNGNVRAQQLTVRGNALIIGDIVADTVHVYGQVRGLIKAKNVFLFTGSHIEGVIMHESVTIEDGAEVDGKLKRVDQVDSKEDITAQEDDEQMKVLQTLRLIS
jgi:cytoskeletal protein CcmA (bactofilin family)